MAIRVRVSEDFMDKHYAEMGRLFNTPVAKTVAVGAGVWSLGDSIFNTVKEVKNNPEITKGVAAARATGNFVINSLGCAIFFLWGLSAIAFVTGRMRD